jgi:hypothetical protein
MIIKLTIFRRRRVSESGEKPTSQRGAKIRVERKVAKKPCHFCVQAKKTCWVGLVLVTYLKNKKKTGKTFKKH